MLRLDNEIHPIYGVMNPGLYKKALLAADEYTVAGCRQANSPI
jgi:hypothetical protein